MELKDRMKRYLLVGGKSHDGKQKILNRNLVYSKLNY